MLDIDLAILYPMLDRMLGGGHEDEPSPRRPPSDIELPLAARIVRLFLEELRLAWQSTLAVQFEVSQVESRPRTLRVLPSDETVAVAGFTLSLGNHQGMMLLCLPCRAVRRLVDQLAESKSQRQSSANDGADQANPCDNRIEVVVSLATTSIAANDLHSLQVGDIIATETSVDAPAIVLIDGRPKFQGKPGSCHGRKAVVLLQSTDDGRD
jgi:flagellar motor switch protein FliM